MSVCFRHLFIMFASKSLFASSNANLRYSVFYTYGLNLSGDSILVAIIMHATINTFGSQIPWNENTFLDAPNSIQTLLMLPAVLLLVLCVGLPLGRNEKRTETAVHSN